MIELGVGEQRDLRAQVEQRTIRLVSLDDDPFA
jgi:hypothetical protein